MWIIALFEAIGIAAGIYDTVTTLPTGWFEAARDTSKNLFDHLAIIGIIALTVAGTVELLRLKRRAFGFFVAALLASLIYNTLSYVFDPLTRVAFQFSGYRGLIVASSLELSVILYVWWLRRRHVLQ